MKTIELLTSAWYGDRYITLDFPANWDVRVIGDQPLPHFTSEAINERVLSPVAGPPLSDLATNRTRAIILIDDLTRPTPTEMILPVVINELFKAGMDRDQITILVAGGTHAPASREAILKKLGGKLSSDFQIVAHDSHGEMIHLGKSAAGTPININPLVMDGDLRIGIGCIYPHPAAGFSGGAKILVPGAAGADTIRFLHDHFRGADQRGGDINNEFKREIEQITDQIGLDFIVNAALNQQRQISGIYAGDRKLAFERGVEFVRKNYAVDVHTDFDVSIADMYPFDVDLQFAFDRGMWPLEHASKDTKKVILASCPEGIGSHALYPIKNSFWIRLGRRIRYFRWRDVKTIPYRLGAARKLMSRKSLQISMVSSGLSEDQLRSTFPSANVYAEWSTARTSFMDDFLGREVSVGVYRCAPLMFPKQIEPGDLK